jgi:hypothetical protein
VLSAMLASH